MTRILSKQGALHCSATLLPQSKADDGSGAAGIIEAVVSVFNNVDAIGDRIRPGAFTRSLARKLPKGVWGHDWETPVAKTLEARELLAGDTLLPQSLAELGGLYIKAQFNLSTQRGREAFSDIEFGIVDEFSIGYRVKDAAFDEETGIYELLEIELYEWSPVLVGMNPATALISCKGQPFPGADGSSDLVARITDASLPAEERKAAFAEWCAPVISALDAKGAPPIPHPDEGKADTPPDGPRHDQDAARKARARFLATLAAQNGVALEEQARI